MSVLCFWGLPNSTGQQLTTPETVGSERGEGAHGTPLLLWRVDFGERGTERPRRASPPPQPPRNRRNQKRDNYVPKTSKAIVPSLSRQSYYYPCIIIGLTRTRQRTRIRSRKEAKTVPNKDKLPFPGAPTWRGMGTGPPFSCFGNRAISGLPQWASQSQIAKIDAISVR